MTDIDLTADGIRAVVSTVGGVLWHVDVVADGAKAASLLRAPPEGDGRDPLASACFPLVPFGNRIAGNRFSFEGTEHLLEPNVPWDPHYLHGDGWLSEWSVRAQSRSTLRLGLAHASRQTPYRYDAEQEIELGERSLTLRLSIVNRGRQALPFGLGWHPYFPLTPRTRLQARATGWWTEGEGWLPDREEPLRPALDFNVPRLLPRHWVNNGFEGWDGKARIAWPETGRTLTVEADRRFSRYFVFVSDPAFDKGYDFDFFCFEPMSHSANAHNIQGGAGLVRLAPGESMAGSMTLRWQEAREA